MLTDSFNRHHNYLRVSVTDRCNLRCIYCMPEEGLQCIPHDAILRNEEIVRLIKIFVEMGINKIRFTGGEPFVRKGFADILRQTRALSPDLELAVTTNAVLLDDYLPVLQKYGVSRLNISLDTLSQERFRFLTRRDSFREVLKNIDAALSCRFFNVKLNAVLFEETISELDAFLEFCCGRDLTLRFIERMPFSEADRAAGFTSSDLLLEKLSEKGTLVRTEDLDTSVSRNYNLEMKDGRTVKLGIIPPMSHKFCSVCNRLRLTADGLMKTCLLSSAEYNLKDALRSGEKDENIRQLVADALMKKGEGHHLDDEYGETLDNRRTMSKIGG